MKSFSLFIALLFLTVLVQAQDGKTDTTPTANEKLVTALTTNLEKVNFVSSIEELQGAVNSIESISQKKSDRWEPAYHAAYSYMVLATRAMEEDVDLTAQYVDKAQYWLDKTFEQTEPNSETHAMQAYIYIGRIWKEPMTAAMKYSPMAIAKIEKSIELNPENPRAYYLKGMNLFHTPVFFGGGPENSKPIFLTAKEKFNQFEKTSPLLPDWGEDANNYFLEKCGVTVED